VLWAKFSGTHEQTLSPSVSWSSGTLAVAAYGSRSGMSLTETSESDDVFGVGLGMGLGRGIWTVGLALDRTVDPHRTIARSAAYSTLGATVGFNPGKLWSFALSGGITLDRPSVQAGRLSAAVGWRVSPSFKLETVAALPDLTQGVEGELGLFTSYQVERFYLSAGANYLTLPAAPQALLRVGVVLGAVDLSAFFTYVFKDAENPFHGGALRIAL
jgi:hypothetical protein